MVTDSSDGPVRQAPMQAMLPGGGDVRITVKEWERTGLENMRLRLRNDRLVTLLREVIDGSACDEYSVTMEWLDRAKAEVG